MSCADILYAENTSNYLRPELLSRTKEDNRQLFKESLQKLLDYLSHSEKKKSEPRYHHYDYVFVFGCDDLEVLKEAADLYSDGKAANIIVTGGIGRLTLPLLEIQDVFGSLKNIYPDIDLAELVASMGRLRGEVDIEAIREELGQYGISESLLIKAYIVNYLITSKGVRKEDVDGDIVVEDESSYTMENVIYGLKKINRPQDKKFILLQTPLQQRRTAATFRKFSSAEISSYPVYTFSVQDNSHEQNIELAAKARDEFLRIILYGEAEIDPKASIEPKRGLQLDGEIPPEIWQSFRRVDAYIDRASVSEELDRLRRFLVTEASL